MSVQNRQSLDPFLAFSQTSRITLVISPILFFHSVTFPLASCSLRPNLPQLAAMQSTTMGDLSISVLGPSAEQTLKATFQALNTCLLDISNSQAWSKLGGGIEIKETG